MSRTTFSALVLALGMALPGPLWAEPPPHAPAHGYRHKHASGAELVFDSGFGVYVVVDLPGHFYHGGRFYRQAGARWEVAGELGGGWSVVASGALPAPLLSVHAHGHSGPKPPKYKRKYKHKRKR